MPKKKSQFIRESKKNGAELVRYHEKEIMPGVTEVSFVWIERPKLNQWLAVKKPGARKE